MGLPIVRTTDKTVGHGCFPPQKVLQGSGDVFVEGMPGHRSGDKVQPHGCHGSHQTKGGRGSSTVFINGKAVQRVTDKADCGSVYISGSSTVFSG